MLAPRESEMSERRAVAVRRIPAQEQVETRAVEIASRTDARLDGHEDLCTERFKNLDAKVDGVKEDIQRLNDDAKNAITEQGVKQESYHKSNAETLAGLKAALAALTSERSGARGMWSTLAEVVKIAVPLGTLAFLIWGNH